MPKALFVEVQAKSGAETEISDFLRNALATVENEPETRDWYALRFDAQHFGVFDTFDGNLARLKHLVGQASRGLMVRSLSSLNGLPDISIAELVAAKLPSGSGAPGCALYVHLETKLGQGRDFGEFLVGSRALVDAEHDTLAWYALRIGPNSFALIDFFADEDARQAHLNGTAVAALSAQVGRFLDVKPELRPAEVLASKRSGWDAMRLAAQQMHPEESVRIAPESA